MSNKIEVGISANDAGFTSTIKKVNQSTQTMDDTVKKVAGNVASSFGSMVKAGAGLAIGFGAIKLAGAAVREVFQGFGEALDLGGELSDLSARTGETAGNLTVLQQAFDNAGSSADKVGPSINKMQKFLDDAAQGTQLNIETMGRLGVTMDELKGKTPTEQMQVLAERISAIQDPTERGALAMKVFGKSGGELLPLLQNFSGELATAKSQLGSLPGVMDKSSGSFDTISDNLTKLKTKFRDLAAGLLDRLAPALEFATTMLTRLDAAAIGMKIGDILIGAGEGMKSFNDALKAVSMGEFGLSWKIAFTAAKLTAAESFNSMLNNAKAAFAAVAEFVKVIMGPGSGMWTVITGAFDLAGLYLSKSISKGLQASLEGMPGWGSMIAQNIGENIAVIDRDIANKSNQMKNALGQVPDDLIYGMEQANKVFDKTLISSKDLIDTSSMQKQLDADKLELKRKTLEYLLKEIAEQKQAGGQAKESVTTAMKIAELEKEIVQAKKDGNVERQRELEASKAYYQALDKALKDGKSLEEAVNSATKARSEYIEKISEKQKEVTSELKDQTEEMAKQVNFSKDMLDAINQRKQEEEIDPKGKLRDKFAEAEAKGDIGGMERARNKMLQKEEEAQLDKAFHDVTGKDNRAAKKSVRDMAKELGLDTTGKSNKEIRDEIKKDLDKKKQEKDLRDAMKKDLDEKQKGKDDPNKKGEKEAPKDGKNDTLSKISSAVDAIKTAVLSLEKKLPQPALGY